MMEFFDKCGIDKESLRFSICAGGNYLGKEMPLDKDSLEALVSLGIKHEHIVANKGRTNFMLSQGMVLPGIPRPSGYNIEVYTEHKGKLVEIASSNIYEFLGHNNRLYDIINSGVGIGFGIERIDYVTQNLDSVYQTDFYQNMKNGISESIGMGKLATQMFLDKMYRTSEFGKAITLLINDGQEFDKTKRGKIMTSYLAKAVSDLAYMGVDHEKFIEILKKEMTKKYADSIYGVSIDEKTYGIFAKALKDKYEGTLGIGMGHCMEN